MWILKIKRENIRYIWHRTLKEFRNQAKKSISIKLVGERSEFNLLYRVQSTCGVIKIDWESSEWKRNPHCFLNSTANHTSAVVNISSGFSSISLESPTPSPTSDFLSLALFHWNSKLNKMRSKEWVSKLLFKDARNELNHKVYAFVREWGREWLRERTSHQRQ